MGKEIELADEVEVDLWCSAVDTALKQMVNVKLDENGQVMKYVPSQEKAAAVAAQYADEIVLEYRKRAPGG